MAGVYANFVNVSFSDYEFTLTFARVEHEVEEGDLNGVIVSRVNASPRLVQDLLAAQALASSIRGKRVGWSAGRSCDQRGGFGCSRSTRANSTKRPRAAAGSCVARRAVQSASASERRAIAPPSGSETSWMQNAA